MKQYICPKSIKVAYGTNHSSKECCLTCSHSHPHAHIASCGPDDMTCPLHQKDHYNQESKRTEITCIEVIDRKLWA